MKLFHLKYWKHSSNSFVPPGYYTLNYCEYSLRETLVFHSYLNWHQRPLPIHDGKGNFTIEHTKDGLLYTYYDQYYVSIFKKYFIDLLIITVPEFYHHMKDFIRNIHIRYRMRTLRDMAPFSSNYYSSLFYGDCGLKETRFFIALGGKKGEWGLTGLSNQNLNLSTVMLNNGSCEYKYITLIHPVYRKLRFFTKLKKILFEIVWYLKKKFKVNML